MGIFDKLKNAAMNAKEGFEEAYDWAIDQDLRTIYKAMQKTKLTEVAKMTGYKSAFREICEKTEVNALIQFYDDEVSGNSDFFKGNPAKEIIEDVLVIQGIFERDEDGVIIR